MNRTNRKHVTIETGIQRIPSKNLKYRARKTVNGVRLEFRTNNLAEAKKWMTDMTRKANKSKT